MERLFQDLRFAARLLWKDRSFSITTIATLALCLGANVAIFAVVNSVLLRSLPYQDTDRLVNIWSDATLENRPRNPLSPADFLDVKQMNTTLEDVGGYFTFVDPEWLLTSIARPWAGTLPTPVASTRHHWS